MIPINQILQGDCLEGLKKLPDKCINCCVTSPPYYGLRDYGNTDQIGLEATPEMYVQRLVDVFTEVYRVLRDDGTLWLNLGDTYAAYYGDKYGKAQSLHSSRDNIGNSPPCKNSFDFKTAGFKPKDLIGIPWMVAFALRSSGWYLRQDIIWHKPNPMPESVTDRCTKSHEYIFLFSKSQKYFYDQEAIKTFIAEGTIKRLQQSGIEFQNGSFRVPGKTNGPMKPVGEFRKGYNHRGPGDKKLAGHTGNLDQDGNIIGGGMANKKSVWTVTTMPYKQAHFATFPEDLIVDCIKAGTSEHGCCSKCGASYERQLRKVGEVKQGNGQQLKQMQIIKDYRGESSLRTSIFQTDKVDAFETIGWEPTCKCGAGIIPGIVLDPFMGAGTTALVSSKLNRNFIGFELNADYIKIASTRLQDQLGMFNIHNK